MIVKLLSFGISGIEAYPVEIEVDVSKGLPQTNIVGLPDSVVKESRERIRVSIKNSGFKYPKDRVTVSLHPADVKKEGPGFDLPIALGILASSGQINSQLFQGLSFLGELGLDGSLKGIKGVLVCLLEARKRGIRSSIIPSKNSLEAIPVRDIEVFGANTLRQAIYILENREEISPIRGEIKEEFLKEPSYPLDFSEIKGQYQAKRAVEVGVAGFHNLLMIGPPGSGKTMLAKRIPTIMPPLSLEEALETSKIHSLMGLLPQGKPLIMLRPFRNPHHTTSSIALVGGGQNIRPGEISLAHNGVLFMDELPEFHRDVLEVLRQPLEDGYINIARAQGQSRFPARFMLVASMNPCPCGYYTHPRRECRCTPQRIHNYISKISGPLLDRIDIHIQVPALDYKDIKQERLQENSAQIRQRIIKARDIQRKRFQKERIHFNSQMTGRLIKKYCLLDKEADNLLKIAMEELSLSLRAYDKILKVSRTIADLEAKEEIDSSHISEAINYRTLDREIFR